MNLKIGDKVTVKQRVESYESREVSPFILPQFVGTYLEPGQTATVHRVNVPYVSKRGTFTFVRWITSDGLELRAGIANDNIKRLRS